MKIHTIRKSLLILLLVFGAFVQAHAQVNFLLSTADSPIDDKTEKGDSIVYRGKKRPVHETLTIIQYRYSVARAEPLRLSVVRIRKDLSDNAQSGINLYSEQEVNIRMDSIAELNEEITELEAEQDSLFAAYMVERISDDRCTFFPNVLESRATFSAIYGNGGQRFRAMNSAGIQFGNNGTASIYSEVVGGNLGLLRVGFGTMLTSDDSGNDSTAQTDQAYQRLVTNGGNTVLTLEYPLLYAHSRNNQFNAIVRPLVKGTADLPAFGTSTDKWAGSMMFGLDAYFDAALDNNQLRFFANINSFYIRGTDVYQSNLAIESPDFSFGQLTFGLVFLENFKISFIVATWSTQAVLRNRAVAVGGQVLR